MTNKSAELTRVNGDVSRPSPNLQPQSGPLDPLHSRSGNGNEVFKNGPLFISSKGIGWTSWKKRWFILTQTSLVFFRSDPSVISQKGNEVNLTLGGIDLNNSGSVVVKEDKKLLIVQFPNVRDGRAFTLKAETLKDLYEWKLALENALAQAPNAANLMGQNNILRSDQTDSLDNYLDQLKDRETIKYTVIGRPILLALEEVDGTPSFLEKALRFIEEHGVKVEGILRQAADVDDVENRVREYEQGKIEFSKEEDAHVIADCVKHVLREFPSSPVPASCCKALLEASRTARASRVSNMRAAICDTFPEPNRRLLQRILLMMQTIASHKADNRMSSSAVAACMAPLLLRPLLAGDCQIENDFDVGGDGSLQLLQAAAAANHAQAIVITLLEEYDIIFGEGSASPGPDMFMDSEDSGSESEEATDDDLSYDDYYDDEQDESIQESDVDEDDDLVSEINSETGDSMVSDEYNDKDHDLSDSSSKSSEVSNDLEVDQMLSTTSLEVSLCQCEDTKSCESVTSPNNTASVDESNEPTDIIEDLSQCQTTIHKSNCPIPSSCMNKSITIPNNLPHRCRNVLGRNSARKNLSMESIDYVDEYEAEIEKLEDVQTELQNQIAEVKVNAKLHSNMETQKQALQERHLALEQNVARLQEQLLNEKSSRATLEAGLKLPPETLSDLSSVDEKTKADLDELAMIEVDLANLERKVNEIGMRLNVQLERNGGSMLNFYNQSQQISNYEINLKNKPDTEVAAISESDWSLSKDTHFGGAENGNEGKLESTPLPNKHPSSSKKSGTRREGSNSTPSALAKLTSKLSILKERRSQISNEFQNINGGKGSELQLPLPSPNKSRGYEFNLALISPKKSRGYEFNLALKSPNKSRGNEFLPPPSPNRPRGSENHSPPNPEKDRCFGSSPSLQTSDEGPGNEGQSFQHSNKLKKSDSQPHHSDKQNLYSQLYLKRGRSEGHYQPHNVDKGHLF